MKIIEQSGIFRFFTVVKLFIDIFWAFYSIKYKALWHKRSWVDERRQDLYVSQARYYRKTAIKMGGLLIKLGQFFSTRVDILPRASIDELSGLQDEVPSVPFEQIKAVIEEELAAPLEQFFPDFKSEPLASASLGQVHRAVLGDGREAAVKIQRPDIDNLIRIDLQAIYQVIGLIKLFTDWEQKINFDAIFIEFKQTLEEELDYIQEGHNAEKTAENNNDDNLITPRIYWEYTTRRVLTMEYLQGIKITDYDLLKQHGVERKNVAAMLLKTYVKQILIDGFYHADPHPGNLFVTNEGKLIMLDFGMVGRITTAMREKLVEMVFALVNRDYDQVTSYLKELGFIRYDYDNQVLNRAISIFLEEFVGQGQDLSQLDLQILLRDLETLFYEQPFQIPSNFTFLGKALGTLYGICIGLDPEISFIDVAKPYVNEIAPKADSVFRIVKERTQAIGNAFLEIPPLAEKFLRRAERGDFNLTIPMQQLNETLIANTRATRAISWAISGGFSLLAGAFLMVNDEKTLSTGLFIFALLSFLFMLKSKSKPTRRKAPHPPIMFKR